jgi:hypothetical protein
LCIPHQTSPVVRSQAYITYVGTYLLVRHHFDSRLRMAARTAGTYNRQSVSTLHLFQLDKPNVLIARKNNHIINELRDNCSSRS